jgi:integrase
LIYREECQKDNLNVTGLRAQSPNPLPRSTGAGVATLLGLGSLMRYQEPPLQKTQGKTPKWFIRPYVDVLQADGTLGRERRRFYLGSTESVKKDEAKAKRKEVLTTLNNGKHVLQAQVSFNEILDLFDRKFVNVKGNLAASTVAKYSSHISNHIRPAFGPLSTGDIDTQRIKDWLKAKEEAGLSWSTRSDLRNLMRCIFREAIGWGLWHGDNPAKDAKPGRKRMVRKPKKLTVESTRNLLLTLREDVRLIVMIALFCTLRISEVLGLQWKHIDLVNGQLIVEQRYWRGNLDLTKTVDSERKVKMGYLGNLLQCFAPGPQDPEQFVFSIKTKKGVCRDDRDIRRYFLTPIAKALGVYTPGFGFHSFRREAITEIAHESDPYQAMRAAGHSKMDTSLGYALVDEERQDQTIRRYQQRVLGPTGLLNASDTPSPQAIQLVAPEVGPQKAKVEVAPSEYEFATAFIFNGVGGGPDRTRICDLYRVKVAL